MIVPRLFEWKRVCLDTTVVFNLILSLSASCNDPVSLFTKRLIEHLANRRDANGNALVTFCISPVTLCEILDTLDSQDKIRKIVNALSSPNVDFVNFDTDVANFMTHKYHSYLLPKVLNDMAIRHEVLIDNLVNAREWIYKDFMIICTADYSNCDVLITHDFKTLYPIAKEVGYACALAYPECFEVLPRFIHQYDEKAAEAFYQARIKKPQTRRDSAASRHKNGAGATHLQAGATNGVSEAKEEEELKPMPRPPKPTSE